MKQIVTCFVIIIVNVCDPNIAQKARGIGPLC